MHYDCLIVDDETEIAKSTGEYFNLFGISAAWTDSYDSCLLFLKEHTVSLLLLDINLGGQSGFALCKRLREETDIPILFISARTDDDDILTALNLGGDDYITKPFTLSILLAKVKAVLKRCAKDAKSPPLSVGQIMADTAAHKVYKGGEPVHLKEMEYKLLLYLLAHKNQVLSRETLLSGVWPDPFVGEGTLSVHIRHLREKLEDNPNEPVLIKTVWGVGYRLEDDHDT